MTHLTNTTSIITLSRNAYKSHGVETVANILEVANLYPYVELKVLQNFLKEISLITFLPDLVNVWSFDEMLSEMFSHLIRSSKIKHSFHTFLGPGTI